MPGTWGNLQYPLQREVLYRNGDGEVVVGRFDTATRLYLCVPYTTAKPQLRK
jgi:hypothetical protein